MPEITNPQAIKFCNGKIRPISDALTSLFYACDALEKEWTAQQLANLIPNDSSEVIDGATVLEGEPDGRPPIVGSDVHNVLNRVIEMRNDYAANNYAILNTLLRVAVNRREFF